MIFINSQLTLWHFKYLLSIYPAAELPFTLHSDIQCDICDIEVVAHTYTDTHSVKVTCLAAQCCGQDESRLLGWFVTHIHNT